LLLYFHSVSVFPRKSRKVCAPLSSLAGTDEEDASKKE
jgi:hypothetical protein